MILADNLSRLGTLVIILALVALTVVLRISYAGHLFVDDGLWFTAAEQILRGKALYREIFFDKPPGLPLLYAAIFKVGGAHVITIRLFTMVCSLTISALLYFLGAHLYSRGVGLIAAALFTVFSTTYISGQMQGLSTDFLMAAPYTASVYLFMLSMEDQSGARHSRFSTGQLAFFGGMLAGLAFQINPKGLLCLVFLAVLSIFSSVSRVRKVLLSPSMETSRKPVLKTANQHGWLFASAFLGFIGGNLPFILYVAGTHSLSRYWSDVWQWGFRYAGYYPFAKSLKGFFYHWAGYLLTNNTLLIALLFVSAVTLRRVFQVRARRHNPDQSLLVHNNGGYSLFRADAILLLWFAISLIGVITGGRFFGHYYFQVLPSLSLIGSRGLTGIEFSLRHVSKPMRTAVIALLIGGFLFTLVRFHGRTALLAADWIRGNKSDLAASWGEAMNDTKDQVTAAETREMPDLEQVPDRIGIEEIRADRPDMRGIQGPADYLFVWGYRPQIYFFSGLIPASRYLSTQPLTGIPADLEYQDYDQPSVLEDSATAKAREELVMDLEQTNPKYIVDVLGPYNLRLGIENYPELQRILTNYKRLAAHNLSVIYIRRDLWMEQHLRRKALKARGEN